MQIMGILTGNSEVAVSVSLVEIIGFKWDIQLCAFQLIGHQTQNVRERLDF